MADLLEQVAQLPRFEYIPPNRIKARPIQRGHWTVDRSYRNACPQCGESKHVGASLCYQCAFNRCRAPLDQKVYESCGRTYRNVPLNKGLYTSVDEEDYERIMLWRWRIRKGNGLTFEAVTDHCLDLTVRPLEYSQIQMPHIILQLAPSVIIDHKNRNALDNRKSNLRICETRAQNGWNRAKNKNNKSGYKGVWKCTHGLRYQTCINVNGQKINIGNFLDPKEAAFARDVATMVFHGEEFGVFNFPELIERIRQKAQLERPRLLSKLIGLDDSQSQ